jgi:hypothetical protein
MPSSKRPSDRSSRLAAVIASSAGVRVYSCRIPDAMCARLVFAATYPRRLTASKPYSSGTVISSAPAFS